MIDPTAPDIFLMLAAAAGTLWALAPTILSLLGISWINYRAEDDPRTAEPPDNDSNYRKRFEALQKLGFSPMGTCHEHRWFAPTEWWHVSHVRVMGTSDGKCFAALYRLFGEGPVRVALETITSGEHFISTAMPGVGLEHRDELMSRIEHPEVELDQLLQRHREHVEKFCKEHSVAAVGKTLAERTALDERKDKILLRKIAEWQTGWITPLVFFVAPSVAGYFMLTWLAVSPVYYRVVAFALCLGTLAYLYVRKVVLPRSLREAAEESHCAGSSDTA